MKNNRDIHVPQLSELPIFKAINTYDPSDFKDMTKEELVTLIPSEARASWNKPEILEKTNAAYDYAKQYFAKHAEGLSNLRAGQLCLRGEELNEFSYDKPVYLLTGLWWLPYVNQDGFPRGCVNCKMQKLTIETHCNYATKAVSLHCDYRSHNYDDDQVIYPIPLPHLELKLEIIENLKKAITALSSVV